MKKRHFSSSSSSSFALEPFRRTEKKKRSSFPLYQSPSTPLSAKLALEPGVWDPLFPSLDTKQITRLLRTNKEIQQVALDYLKQLPITCYKETEQWSLLCLDPRHGECLAQCVSFGFGKLLENLSSLLGTKVTFQRKKKFAEIVSVNVSEETVNPKFSLYWSNDTDGKEEMIYEEVFYGTNRLESKKTRWDISKKHLIIPRIQQLIQHNGATIEIGLDVRGKDVSIPEQTEIISERGQSLGVFNKKFSPVIYGGIWFDRTFFVPPRQKRFLSPLVSEIAPSLD